MQPAQFSHGPSVARAMTFICPPQFSLPKPPVSGSCSRGLDYILFDSTTSHSVTYELGQCAALISDDGLNFTWDPGERLHYSGKDNEAGGIRNPYVIRLPSGKYRMYYAGLPGTGSNSAAKVLSAFSWDGLDWTRENGVRWDPINLCPAATTSGVNPKVFLDHNGTYHIFNAAAACDDVNHSNEAIGIFEGTSPDGMSFTFSRTAVVQGYYIKSQYHENPGDPFVNPEDPMLILTPAGFRMYFNCPKSGTSNSDARYHSVVNSTLY